MPFQVRARISQRNHVRCDSTGADAAMATNFGTQFTTTGFLAFDGLNFGCVIASDTLFDSRSGFSGSSYPMKT